MADDPFLHQEHEWQALWWLPDDPDAKVPGTLRYSPPDGLQLFLLGGFDTSAVADVGVAGIAFMGEEVIWPVILGEDAGQLFTLLDCALTSTLRSFGATRPRKQNVSAQTALVGCHLREKSAPVFAHVEASIENLSVWSGNSTLHKRDYAEAEGPAETLTAQLSGSTARLTHGHTYDTFGRTTGSVYRKIADTAVIGFEPHEPQPMDTLLRMISDMQDLLSFSSNTACGVLWKRLYLPPQTTQDLDNHVASRLWPVDVYRQSIVKGDPEAKAPRDDQMLFTLADVQFESVLPRWFEVSDRFRPAINLLLGLRYISGGYLETQLLTVVGAAEAFHLALELDPPIPEEEFKELKSVLLKAVPVERKQWLSGLLARNDPPLKKRLLDLANRPGAQTMRNLVPDPEKWAKVTRDARNNLTHTGNTTKHSLEVLFAAMTTTAAVVTVNLLHALGFSEAELELVMEKNTDQLQLAAQYSNEYLR
ncbi:hypothetical protein OOZ51_19490 [Arthrobacter sp. MI7-26]|uniref:ApeA N-terminal domain 1-containing protein n=1 Tax=Arthrobacter sp. MI7-26 TaxID=2993653 RepID=UPI0022498B0E|nr:HEPN domain-containing protein [Arthrobacter sp. MI7-26]MCX2749975.1 hypothetical protein [Arthrobacter sp. MI7-26]